MKNFINILTGKSKKKSTKYKWHKIGYSKLGQNAKNDIRTHKIRIGDNTKRYTGRTFQYEVRTVSKGGQGSTDLVFYRRLKK